MKRKLKPPWSTLIHRSAPSFLNSHRSHSSSHESAEWVERAATSRLALHLISLIQFDSIYFSILHTHDKFATFPLSIHSLAGAVSGCVALRGITSHHPMGLMLPILFNQFFSSFSSHFFLTSRLLSNTLVGCNKNILNNSLYRSSSHDDMLTIIVWYVLTRFGYGVLASGTTHKKFVNRTKLTKINPNNHRHLSRLGWVRTNIWTEPKSTQMADAYVFSTDILRSLRKHFTWAVFARHQVLRYRMKQNQKNHKIV